MTARALGTRCGATGSSLLTGARMINDLRQSPWFLHPLTQSAEGHHWLSECWRCRCVSGVSELEAVSPNSKSTDINASHRNIPHQKHCLHECPTCGQQVLSLIQSTAKSSICKLYSPESATFPVDPAPHEFSVLVTTSYLPHLEINYVAVYAILIWAAWNPLHYITFFTFPILHYIPYITNIPYIILNSLWYNISYITLHSLYYYTTFLILCYIRNLTLNFVYYTTFLR